MVIVISENSALKVLIENQNIAVGVDTAQNEERITPDMNDSDEEYSSMVAIQEKRNQRLWRLWKKRRYLVGLLSFFGFYNIYALRVNLSIAIVAMTDTKVVLSTDGNITYVREFDWDSKQQGFILSAFFYGYITTQIIGGWLAAKYGGKRIFGLGIAVTAALTLVTPFAAKHSFYLLLAVRGIEGVFEGMTYPCHYAIWSRWSPPLERTRWIAASFSGSFVGTVISMPVCALLASAFGWESVFYIYGAIGLLWYALWWYLVAETPDQDLYISQNELNYIQNTLKEENSVEATNPPWRKILTSAALFPIVVAHCSETWGFYTLLTQMPKFIKDVLHFDLSKTGFLAAVPYLAMSIISQIAGMLGDWLQIKKYLSRVHVRKLFTCGAFLSQTVFMLLITYFVTPVASMVCLTLAVGIGAFAYSGFCVNYMDIAPNFSSILYAVGNTLGSLSGVLAPTVTGYVVTTGDEKEWSTVFYITSGIYLTGAVIYGCFATADIQKWATKKDGIVLNKRTPT